MQETRIQAASKAGGISRTVALVATLLAALFAASGCILSGGGGGQSGGTATVRVGTTNSSSDAPFFIGDKKGYFEEQGIKVEFNSFDSAAKMIAPLGNGDLDVAAGAPSAGLYNAVARGVDFKMVADKGSTPAGYGYMPLLVTSGSASSFDGYEDLEGMKVAEPAQGTATSSTLNEALKKAGLSYDDVEHEYIGFPDHVAALENGSIDASLTTEPSATRAIQTGAATRFAGTDEIYPDQQLAVVLYSGQFAQDDAEVARKFMVGYLRAVRDYNDALNNGKLAGPNAEEVISILTEFTPVKDAGLYQEMTPNGVDPNGELNLDSLEKDLQFFKDEGLLESDAVTIDGVVDTSFVEAASEELGPYEKPEEG